LEQNLQITNVTGHSLGGAVAVELQQREPETHSNSTTYGAPVFPKNGLRIVFVGMETVYQLSAGVQNQYQHSISTMPLIVMLAIVKMN
jgi:hypothetical protein